MKKGTLSPGSDSLFLTPSSRKYGDPLPLSVLTWGWFGPRLLLVLLSSLTGWLLHRTLTGPGGPFPRTHWDCPVRITPADVALTYDQPLQATAGRNRAAFGHALSGADGAKNLRPAGVKDSMRTVLPAQGSTSSVTSSGGTVPASNGGSVKNLVTGSASELEAAAEAARAAAILHLRQLTADITRHVSKKLVDRCLAIVRAQGLQSFGRARQDWVVYHTFFRHMRYGEGFYLDVGTSGPGHGSTTFFFDACLGWKGICINTNPTHTWAYQKHRTCSLFTQCPVPGANNSVCNLAQKAGGVPLEHRNLQHALVDEGVGQTRFGQRKIDLVSVDLLGEEYRTLRCFPFDAFDAPVWVVANNHDKWRQLEGIMGRGGYWASPSLLLPLGKPGATPGAHGVRHCAIFTRWNPPAVMSPEVNSTVGRVPLVPTMVLGPSHRPGHPMHGASFQPPCPKGKKCPESVPTVGTDYEMKFGRFVGGACPPFNGVRHRLSWG